MGCFLFPISQHRRVNRYCCVIWSFFLVDICCPTRFSYTLLDCRLLIFILVLVIFLTSSHFSLKSARYISSNPLMEVIFFDCKMMVFYIISLSMLNIEIIAILCRKWLCLIIWLRYLSLDNTWRSSQETTFIFYLSISVVSSKDTRYRSRLSTVAFLG